MANEDRTEKPTAKKLKDARKRGQVARSRDLVGACSLVAVTGLLGWWSPYIVSGLSSHLVESLGHLAEHAHGNISSLDVSTVTWLYAGRLMLVVAPVFLTSAVAGILTNVGQSGWVTSPQALQLNWNRLNPSNGFARFKPSRAGVEVLKGIIAVTVLATIGWQLGRELCERAPLLVEMAPAAVGAQAGEALYRLFWRCGLGLIALAAADYAVQRFRLISSLKMTRQEVRDESKSNDGSPEVKARVRKIQRDMTRRRMLAAVKRATVVVVNPTHVSVALEYRRDRMVAPVVVAKGQDHLAARIRTAAREHGVPIVENVALARALYQGADVGDMIPANLFGAVAEVLAYLVRIKQLMF